MIQTPKQKKALNAAAYVKGYMGNNGKYGCAAVVQVTGKKKKVIKDSGSAKGKTQIYPEYKAMMMALDECVKQGCTKVTVKTNFKALDDHAANQPKTPEGKQYYANIEARRKKINISISRVAAKAEPLLKEACDTAKQLVK